jgi:hypothetical protein
MIVRAATERPLAFRGGDRKVVDAGQAPAHQPVRVASSTAFRVVHGRQCRLHRDEVRDPESMQIYVDAIGATFAGHAKTWCVNHSAFEVLEGPALESVTILEFPLSRRPGLVRQPTVPRSATPSTPRGWLSRVHRGGQLTFRTGDRGMQGCSGLCKFKEDRGRPRADGPFRKVPAMRLYPAPRTTGTG